VACWEDCCLDCDHDSGTATGLSIESLDSVLASSMDPIDYLLTVHSGDACLLTAHARTAHTRILQAWQNTRAQHTRAEHNTRAQHTGPSTREQHNTHSTARSTRAHSTRAQHTRTQHACIQSTRTHNTCAQEHTTGLAEHTRTTHARRAQHTPQCSCDKKAKSCDLTIPVLVEGSCRVRVHSPFTSF
jgi:hypothetical protein